MADACLSTGACTVRKPANSPARWSRSQLEFYRRVKDTLNILARGGQVRSPRLHAPRSARLDEVVVIGTILQEAEELLQFGRDCRLDELNGRSSGEISLG